jgi:hypothetical protein
MKVAQSLRELNNITPYLLILDFSFAIADDLVLLSNRTRRFQCPEAEQFSFFLP